MGKRKPKLDTSHLALHGEGCGCKVCQFADTLASGDLQTALAMFERLAGKLEAAEDESRTWKQRYNMEHANTVIIQQRKDAETINRLTRQLADAEARAAKAEAVLDYEEITGTKNGSA
jgi:preprotein translocase subunit SecA